MLSTFSRLKFLMERTRQKEAMQCDIIAYESKRVKKRERWSRRRGQSFNLNRGSRRSASSTFPTPDDVKRSADLSPRQRAGQRLSSILHRTCNPPVLWSTSSGGRLRRDDCAMSEGKSERTKLKTRSWISSLEIQNSPTTRSA
ncbi:hypothetical protein Cni_G17471 [Canna indica]|uniref:Uncharacterized protein n=1 Tax=Canna indica TaxID=4628 RepID=A0AAQ3KH67_9LILI|nr:hypothetical protein Cni_G17471 [Canna indica]